MGAGEPRPVFLEPFRDHGLAQVPLGLLGLDVLVLVGLLQSQVENLDLLWVTGNPMVVDVDALEYVEDVGHVLPGAVSPDNETQVLGDVVPVLVQVADYPQGELGIRVEVLVRHKVEVRLAELLPHVLPGQVLDPSVLVPGGPVRLEPFLDGGFSQVLLGSLLLVVIVQLGFTQRLEEHLPLLDRTLTGLVARGCHRHLLTQ